MKIEALQADCKNCAGLCCVALYFSASEGFPLDKKEGLPCMNLREDFRCGIHEELREWGLKGCMAYDCYGAGPKTVQHTFGGISWRERPETAEQMYQIYLIQRDLHEMLWYLWQGTGFAGEENLREEAKALFQETENISRKEISFLLGFSVEEHRAKVGALLRAVSQEVRQQKMGKWPKALTRPKMVGGRPAFMGLDLHGADLSGADFRGSLLIAADLSGADLTGADFLGADLRDVDVRGANLKDSLFLTQKQLWNAKGDPGTKLPAFLDCPFSWEL